MARIEASRLEALRRARGLSQRALSEAAGITRQAVGAIESRRMQPSVGIALSLARALDTTVEELFGATPEPEPPAARVATALIAGKSVSYQLDRDHLAIEPSETAQSTVFVAGCDVAVGLLSRHAMARARDVRVLWLSMTNRAAIDALANGRVHAAVIHGEFDARQLQGLRDLVRLEVATTEEGWLVRRGNPQGLRGSADLVRARIRVVNRPAGAGARRLLDDQLKGAKIDPRRVAGYEREVAGQLDAGRAVAQEFADAAVGTASVARVFGLDFLPLREERCTMLVPRAYARAADVRTLIEALRSNAYRRDLQALDAYDTTRTGEDIP